VLLIKNAFRLQAYYPKEGWCQDEAARLQEGFSNIRGTGMAHCECRLISYLTNMNSEDSWNKIPAFSYIGVSKLSCGPCYNWIKAFNSLGGPQFYTRGTHGKWYPSWVMPTTPTIPKLKNNFIYSVSRRYYDFHSQKGGFYPGPDSPVASPIKQEPEANEDFAETLNKELLKLEINS
jgi:OTT_1508-like deaminase